MGLPNVIGIYLAAGESRRMGRSKLSIPLPDGMVLGGYGLRRALSAGLTRTLVVTGPTHPLAWLPNHVERIHCSDAPEGMARSIRCGVKAAKAYDPDAVLIMLADQPWIQSDMIDQLILTYEMDRGLDYVAYSDEGVSKPPVLFDRRMFDPLERLDGDQGARSILQASGWHGKLLTAPNSEAFLDIDTEEEFLAFLTSKGG